MTDFRKQLADALEKQGVVLTDDELKAVEAAMKPKKGAK